VNGLRILYWLVVIGLGGWSLYVALHPAAPIAYQTLDPNHQIKPGDLQTPEIAALTNLYLRRRVKAGEEVTSDMVGDQPGIPVIDSGFVVVVNVPRALREQRGIHDGQSVQISSGNQPLSGAGTVRSVICDENRCAIAVGFDKAPAFDPQALQGADVSEFHPPLPKH
jgi:hypothetical protein